MLNRRANERNLGLTMFLGWKTIYIGDDGMPSDSETKWIASCFILFVWVIYIGEVKMVDD